MRFDEATIMEIGQRTEYNKLPETCNNWKL